MNRIKTRKALNPEYRKHKPKRPEVNTFREELKACLVSIKQAEEANRIGEEFIKQPIQKFLQNTFYKDHLINTKGRIDLAIYTDKEVKSDVGVILELKQPNNKHEYLTETNLNKKALQELVWYYLNERIDGDNNNIKHLIATNGYTWFLFKSEDFYKFFYKNKSLVKEYKDFKSGLKDSSNTDTFYKEIASKYIAEIEDVIPFVYLDFTKKALENYSDPDLNTLFKVFSDVNILGKNFGNDSNELNKEFYQELLHIIGLEELKEKGKKIIYRKKEKDRDYGSLLENTIFTLEDKDYLKNVKRFNEDKAFNAGLALCLSWINRILFLKLLESQLLSYHDNSLEYKFLNNDFIKGFDDLNDLFFSALAKKADERHPKFKDKYNYIPYLNSSLFEKNDLESETFDISALNDEPIEIYKGTILKETNGKKLKGKLSTLDYLFKFLDAFDFATDGTEAISDDDESKTLISASVLGKIFEKLNGYKDGSFYTPSQITMYMCKGTLRRTLVQKFKEVENDHIKNYEDLSAYCYNFFKPEDRQRLNNVFNSIKICDPAVGSGHFLVSALNELIIIKHELGLLIDARGNRLSDYDIELVNDELYITDEKGFSIEYKPENKESTRVQHTLFIEKKAIIENCLYGVDINPNSVKICRLRLWIELLKNTYYTNKGVLDTLPNIDINIKCGNSIISRFKLDDDLTNSFKGINYKYKDYQDAVKRYKASKSKDEKNRVLEIIKKVKANFKSSFDRKAIQARQIIVGKYESEKTRQENLVKLFKEKITKQEKDELKSLKKEADNALLAEQEILNNVIFENSFEWRFEFPEVLDNNGNYIGFDAVIGNPPYGVSITGNERKFLVASLGKVPDFEIYYWFINHGHNILKENGNISYIIPNTILFNVFAQKYRVELFNDWQINELLDCTDFDLFTDATVRNVIFNFSKTTSASNSLTYRRTNKALGFNDLANRPIHTINKETVIANNQNWGLIFKLDDEVLELVKKIKSNNILGGNYNSSQGYIPYRKSDLAKIYGEKKAKSIVENREWHSTKKINEEYKEEIWGKSISKYKFKHTGSFVKYGKHLATYVDLKYFNQKRILIREITNPGIIACLLDEELVNDPQLISIIQEKEDYSLEYLWAILNSKLATFYHFNSSPKATKGSFPKILVYDINNFPLPKESNKTVIKSLKNLTKAILKEKNENLDADTSKLENSIDKIVYGLYNLSEKEIKLIEK
jgi:hypothetical protein